ncbi:hypothetical protein NA57DRAFT_76978 [Rhizodiscina lignyota]|uniref:Zn(2)-C6 fungal-type domain-containing protein n=1 Tax=Rhizodiscina lignyota TaxID=1504668 RepID=A0A9P4M9W4_9PEZI|nr:hypothetical protein NA57DRAFT_76978 [Rhizodiscina lignyota]
MSNQRPGSYPSPNSAQVASGVPFYGQNAVSQSSDVPAMVQLSEELSRQLNNDMHHAENVMIPQPMGQAMHGPDPHQQMAQDAMGHLDGRAEFDDDDDDGSESEGGTRKRKRQKTKEDKRQKNTRACDECRRKKVKCESEEGQELGIEACLACRKSGLQCQFSRVPQKRGPSKGYISKLDERLQNVESAIREYVPQAAHRIGKPEPADLSMYSPGGPIDGMHQAQSGAPSDGRLDYTGNGDTSSFWHSAPPMSVSGPDLSALQSATTQELDENVLKECHQIIQATLPILPADQAFLRALMGQVPDIVRSAFSKAMSCFVRATSPGKGPVDASQIQEAATMFHTAEFDLTTSTAKNLVMIETLILLALTTDALGPVPAHGAAMPSSRSWLSRANILATDIRINLRPNPQKLTEGMGDSESKLARRLYVAIFILDKWYAIGNASPQMISARGLTLLPEDLSAGMLGQQCYQLARLSFVLAHLADIIPDFPPSLNTDLLDPSPLQQMKNMAATLCQAQIDRMREDMQSYIANYPVLHAAFWHVESLVLRLQEYVPQASLVEHAGKVLNILPNEIVQPSPFFHHFAALAGVTLAESAVQNGVEGIAAEASILDQILSRSGREDSWERTISNFVLSSAGNSATMMGLQGLAEAAVGEGQGSAQQVFEGGFDALKVLKEGYLTLFTQKN